MVLAILLTVTVFLAFAASAAYFLMLLLGILSSLTTWPTAISFWASFVITIIIGLFWPRGR